MFKEIRAWLGKAPKFKSRVAARTREIATLSAIAQSANRHVEIEPLLAEALPLLCETIGASAAWVSLLDERGNFRLAGAHNLPPALEAGDRAEMRWLGCTCQRKLLAGELTAATNILECQRLQQARGDTRGLRYHASIPLRARDRVLGLLNLTTADGRIFSDDELRLLSAISAQIAIAIERAQLHEQTKAHHIEEQAALLKLSQALLGETDAQAIMDRAARAASELLDVEFAAIALIDADGQTWSARAGIGWSAEILQQAQRIPLTASTGLAYAIRTQAPVVIPDESRETRFGTPPWVTQMGIVSSLLAPMVVAGQAIGGIVINSRTARAWSDDEVRLLALIANDTALALERAQQYSTALERLERITALHDIDVAITANLDLEERLEVLLEKVTERLRVDAAAVAFIEPETHALRYAARRGLDGEFFQDGPVKVDQGVIGHIVHSGEVVVIADVRTEPRFVRRPIAERLGIVSYLAVPLRARTGIIGVLELATRQPHVFAQEEIDFFVTLAGQAAIAIENARLYQETTQRLRELELLHRAMLAVTQTPDLDAALERVVGLLADELGYPHVAIALVDTAGEQVPVRAQRGIPLSQWGPGSQGIRVGQGLVGWVAQHGQALLVNDVSQDPRYVVGIPETRAELVVPLRVGERTIGVINVESPRVNAFGANDLRLLSTLAGQVASEIERARLFDETRRRAAHQTALNAIIAAAASASTDLQPLLDLALEHTLRALQLEMGALWLTPADGGPRFALRGLPKEIGPATAQPTAAEHLAREPVIVVGDWQTEDDSLAPVMLSFGVRASITAALVTEGKRIGGLSVAATQPRQWSEEESALVQAVARQLGSAIERARLFEETRRRALEQSAVGEIARALNAVLNVRQAFPTIVQGLRALTQCDRVSLVLLDETQEYFTMTVLDEPRPELAQGTRLPITATSAAADILAGRPHLTADLSAEADYPAERALYQAGHRARVNLPLVISERVIGALNLTSRQVGMFIPAQLPVLQQIASAVAIAIENTRLFEAERTRREELAALYDLSRALVQSAYDFDAILNLVARRAVETVRVTFARVAVREGEELVVRAAHPIRLIDRDLEVGRRELVAAHPVCQRVLEQNAPIVLRADSPEINDTERETLFLGLAQTLCLVPLRSGERALGMLMLGEMRREERGSFTAEKIRLARSIGDQAASALQRAELYAELERAYLQTVLALANAVDAKDTYTADHAQRLAHMALAVGRELGMNARELEDLRYGAILHDIGKIGIPDAILKKPAKLDAAEWKEMRQHPIIGARILAPVPRLAGAARIVRHHHERYDGKGYPDGLAGDAIPLGARILTVVDSYSAIVDKRVYKAARSHDEAVAELQKHAGAQFDPRIVEIFLRLLERGIDIRRESTLAGSSVFVVSHIGQASGG
jgi:GAF domain-containing protein